MSILRYHSRQLNYMLYHDEASEQNNQDLGQK